MTETFWKAIYLNYIIINIIHLIVSFDVIKVIDQIIGFSVVFKMLHFPATFPAPPSHNDHEYNDNQQQQGDHPSYT